LTAIDADADIGTPVNRRTHLDRSDHPVTRPEPSLHDVFADHFRVGAAIDLRDLIPSCSELLAHHFSSVTAENAMKPAWAQPDEGRFDLAAADQIARVAATNGQRLYGHTLIWHHQTPDWMFCHADGTPLTSSAADRALLLARAENHISTMAEHFGEQVWAWEVVNEAVEETVPDRLRPTVWRTVLGENYLHVLFDIAHQAAPHATLVLNDFATEQPGKRAALLEVVMRLLDDGAPVSAVGHQFHLSLGDSLEQVDAALSAFADLGIGQVVTELDVSISRTPQESLARTPADRLREQEQFYAGLFSIFRDHASSLEAVTMWGLSDGHSWLRYWPVIRLHEAPLLFDDLLEPKAAFWSVLEQPCASQEPV
jgi:endo-1,4-beta-xylanase